MIEVLLSSVLSCSDAQWILEGIHKIDYMTQTQKTEMMETVLESTPETCKIDLL